MRAGSRIRLPLAGNRPVRRQGVRAQVAQGDLAVGGGVHQAQVPLIVGHFVKKLFAGFKY